MTRHDSVTVTVFLLAFGVLISTLSKTLEVQSFSPSLPPVPRSTKRNNGVRVGLLPSSVTDTLPSFGRSEIKNRDFNNSRRRGRHHGNRATGRATGGAGGTAAATRNNGNGIGIGGAVESRGTGMRTGTAIRSSDWSGFEALDDDDDLSEGYLGDGQPLGGFADENDEQERKAEVGMALPCPEVYWDGEPIFLPQGTILPLTEDNVQGLLAACRIEIGTMFGYTAENRGVGITGGVDFVEMDGPNVVVTLKGRFWHQRPTVLDRVGKYIMGRIPEVVDVIVYDENELSDEVNNAAL